MIRRPSRTAIRGVAPLSGRASSSHSSDAGSDRSSPQLCPCSAGSPLPRLTGEPVKMAFPSSCAGLSAVFVIVDLNRSSRILPISPSPMEVSLHLVAHSTGIKPTDEDQPDRVSGHLDYASPARPHGCKISKAYYLVAVNYQTLAPFERNSAEPWPHALLLRISKAGVSITSSQSVALDEDHVGGRTRQALPLSARAGVCRSSIGAPWNHPPDLARRP